MAENMNRMDSLDTVQPETGAAPVNLRKQLLKLARRWPKILSFFLISITIGYLYNRYLTPVYLVKARITTKKFSDKQTNPVPGLIDASFFLSGLIEVYEEIPILKSYKRIEAAIEKVDLRVSYFSKGLIKTTESEQGYGFSVAIDTIKNDNYPHSVPIYVNKISADEFELHITEDDRWEKYSKKRYKYGQTIRLGAATFRITNTNGKSADHDKYYFIFNRKSDLVQEYSRKLEVTWAMRGSAMLDMKMQSELPDRDLKFMRAYYEVVDEMGLREKNETLDNTIRFIDSQMDIVNDSLNFYQGQVDNLKLDNRKLPLGSESVFVKLNELDHRKADIILNERYLDYFTNYYKENNKEEVFAPSLVGLNVPLMNEWVGQYINRKLNEKGQLSTENSQNPLVNREDSLKKRLEKGIFEAMASSRERNKALLADVDQQVEDIYNSMGVLQQEVRELNKNQRLLQINNNLFDLFIRRKTEAAISKASATSDYRIIDAPNYSRAPIRPDKKLNLMIAAAIGFFLPVFFFVVRDLTNTRIMDKDDLQYTLSMPMLGNVAHSKYTTNKVVQDHPRSVVAESFRAVRANLKFLTSNVKDTAQVLVVTSSVGGEGKTFCTINLASTLALTEKRTLMIGADLRKPQLANYINNRSKAGLSGYLSGTASINEVIHKGEVGEPDFIDAGEIPPNPAELLASQRMEALMQELKDKYDYIIFDTAPIGLVADAMELFKYCDYNILIVRQGVTPKPALRMMNELYLEGKLKNFTVLMNDIELVKSKGSYYGGYLYGMGYSGYGFGYYEEDKVKGA